MTEGAVAVRIGAMEKMQFQRARGNPRMGDEGYVKATLMKAIGRLSDGWEVVLVADPGYGECLESWSEVLCGLNGRGMNCSRVLVRGREGARLVC